MIGERNEYFQKLVKEREGLVFSDIEFPEYGDKEKMVAKYLEELKLELQKNYENEPTISFLTRGKFGDTKETIENTRIFKVLKKFPKGGLLHMHMVASLPTEVIYKLIVSREDGFVYTGERKKDENGIVHKPYGNLSIFSPEDQKRKEAEGWTSLKTLRSDAESPEIFDRMMLEKMYFLASDEEGSSEKRWVKFQSIFPFIMCFFHVEVYREFYFKMVQSFVDDGIFYAELSTPLGLLYDSKNTSYSPEDHVKYFKELDDEARQMFPDWQGAKIRHEDHKRQKIVQIAKTIDVSMDLQTKYPDLVVGFDLVGEEDTAPQMIEFMPMICQKISEAKEKGKKLDFLFHAGESNRLNNNIVDVLLLGTKRIGHGFNLYSSQKAIEIIRKRNEEGENVALEICPVSNKCLGYVHDGRSHPLTSYIRNGIPFVISSDDPGIFAYEGVTFDYFFVFVGNLNFGINDLSALKMISKNSIQFSRMSPEEKKRSYIVWEKKYEQFLDDVLALKDE